MYFKILNYLLQKCEKIAKNNKKKKILPIIPSGRGQNVKMLVLVSNCSKQISILNFFFIDKNFRSYMYYFNELGYC